MKRKIYSTITPILPKWLFSIVIVCAACSIHETSQTTSNDALQSTLVQNAGEPSQKIISTDVLNEHMRSMAFVDYLISITGGTKNTEEIEQELSKFMPLTAYTASVIRNVLFPENDPMIEIKRFPENSASHDLEEGASKDNNQTYVLVNFKEFPGESPYGVYCRRILQRDPNAFLPCDFEQATLNAMCAQNIKPSYGALVSSKGYLPGEQVTWRISSADGTSTKDVSFYPRPMVLKDHSGKTILKAALLTAIYPATTYFIHVPENEDLVECIATSGRDVIKKILPIGQSENQICIPQTGGALGGVAQFEMRFLKDGSSYKMEFPWGSALIEYAEGEK